MRTIEEGKRKEKARGEQEGYEAMSKKRRVLRKKWRPNGNRQTGDGLRKLG